MKSDSPKPKSSKPQAGKVFDVTHPGRAMPAASGKPVIVTNRSIVRDPMTTAPELDGSKELLPTDELPQATSKKSKPRTIEPIHDLGDDAPEENAKKHSVEVKTESKDDTEKDKSEAPAKADEASEPEGIKESEEPEDESKDDMDAEPEEKVDEPKEEKPEEEPGAEDAGDIDETKENLDKELKQNKEATKRKEAAQALIDSKQYFVPINSVKKRRSRKLVVALVVIVLLALGALAALDAGLIDIGIKAPTDFIPN